jgi:uncharacterized membrane protein
VTGLAATGLLADGLHLLLPTQLQFWRVLWLSHCFALLLLPWLFLELRARGLELAGLFLVAGLVTLSYPGALVASLLALLLARGVSAGSVGAGLKGWLKPVLYLVIIVSAAYPLFTVVEYALGNRQLGTVRQLSLLFSVPLFAFALGVAGYLGLTRLPRPVAPFVGIAVLALALHLWDARTDSFRREVEAYASPSQVFPSVQPGQQVFWFDNPLATWVLVRTPSFASSIQCAGLIHSRETTLECARRSRLFKSFEAMHGACDEEAEIRQGEVTCVPDAATVSRICHAFPDLDFLVLEGNVGGWAEASWAPAGGGNRRQYHLHRCGLIRQAGEVIEG